MSKKNDQQVWINVAAGIIIGFAVGGALALLFAPKSGAQLRGDIGDAMDDIKGGEKLPPLVESVQAGAAGARPPNLSTAASTVPVTGTTLSKPVIRSTRLLGLAGEATTDIRC